MLSLKERFDLLETDLKASPPAFTMSSDLPFAIFRYDPGDEWVVRREIQKLAVRITNATARNVHRLLLSKLYWKSIQDSEGVDALIQYEQEYGFAMAEDQIRVYLSDPDWNPLPSLLLKEISQLKLEPQRDLIFLYRAAVFAPSSYRLSSLLEQMMGQLPIPTVLFYPGTWRGSLNYLDLRTEEEPLGSYRVKIYGREL